MPGKEKIMGDIKVNAAEMEHLLYLLQKQQVAPDVKDYLTYFEMKYQKLGEIRSREKAAYDNLQLMKDMKPETKEQNDILRKMVEDTKSQYMQERQNRMKLQEKVKAIHDQRYSFLI